MANKMKEAPMVIVIMILLVAILTFLYIMYNWALFAAPTNLQQLLNNAANISMNSSWYNWYHTIQMNSKMMFQYGLASAVGITIVVGIIYLTKDDEE